MDNPMGRGQKRSESADELPADKRSCSSLELRPSSSNSSSVQTQLDSPKSATETVDTDMDTSSAAAPSEAPSDEEPEQEHDRDRYESDDSEGGEEPGARSILRDLQRQQSSGYTGQLSGLLENLTGESEPSGSLAALTELCEVMSFCSEDSFSGPVADALSSVLVKLARHEENPDIILLSVRAMTYLCDAYPRSSKYLQRHEAIPALCQRLFSIEYLDVAEQCLQALEKISREQPLACLQAGAVMAVLNFIDFFSTSIQRTALSTVVNICMGLRSEDPTSLMGAVPILCNLLHYEDQKLVESAALCLTKVGQWMSQFPEMLDELCKNGLIDGVTRLINSNKTTLPQPIYIGLIGLLAKLSSGSCVAFKRLYELDISSMLKDILSTHDFTHGSSSPHLVDRNCNQVDEVLKLLNEMLPSSVRDQGNQHMQDKESFLVSHPDLLQKLGMNILPILIQVVNSGANMHICFGCLSIVCKLVHLSASDMLAELLACADISSFLAGIFTRKDYHIQMLALQIVEMILQKLSDVYLNSFIKEGVFFAIDALTPEKCSQSMPLLNGGNPKCLCYAFDARQPHTTSESGNCKIQKDSVCNLAEHIKTSYLTPELLDSGRGVTDVLRNLRVLSGELSDVMKPGQSDATSEDEEKFYSILHQIMAKICGGETVSTFEFIESGVLKSLVSYLSNGLRLGDKVEPNGVNSNISVLGRRFQLFARLLLSSTDFLIEGLPLSVIIQRLQNALSSLENFPVILSQAFKQRKSYASVPSGRHTEYYCFRIRFVRGEGEICLRDYSEGTQTVDPFSSLNVIEDFLWPRVVKGKENAETDDQGIEQMDYQTTPVPVNAESSPEGNSGLLSSKSPSPNSHEMQDSVVQEPQCPLQAHVKAESQSSSSSGTENVSPGLTFYLEGHKLDRTLTLYQAIIRQQIRSGNEMIMGAELFSRTHTITYRHDAERKQCESETNACSGQSSSISDEADSSIPNAAAFLSRIFPCKLPSDVDNSSPIYDVLFLLRSLESMNRCSLHLTSCERICAFAEGRLDSLDNLKVSIRSVPRIEFVSSKLTEKLEQQMRDSFAVSPGGLPLWCNELMACCPFLFGFQTRCKYFHLAAFSQRKVQPRSDSGSSGDRQHSPGSLPRKKFLVSRDRILESAAVMMDLHAREKVVLEVVYNEEVGTGLGPTLEFYTLVSQEFQKPGLGMWRDDHSAPPMMKRLCVANSGILMSPFGLFPCPWSPMSGVCNGIEFAEVSKKFMLLGQLVAKAIQNGRMLDLPFSRAFYKLILGQDLCLYDIQTFDPELYKTLLEFEALARRKTFLKSVCGESSTCQLESCFRNTRIEDLCLDFSLPGYPDYVLSGNDQNTLNLANLEEYVKLVVDATVKTGISRQVEAFKSGFNQVFPIEHLQMFTEDELELLLCGEHDSWTYNDLLDHIKFDHGYTASSSSIMNLLEIIMDFNREDRRAFIQFVTGAPRLPPGGLASLHPKLTIVRKQSDNRVDADLPSVMTCANYLKLPPYSSKEIMKEKLLFAITEGQGSFHLS